MQDSLKYSFEYTTSDLIFDIITTGLFLLAIVLIILYFIRRKKRRKNLVKHTYVEPSIPIVKTVQIIHSTIDTEEQFYKRNWQDFKELIVQHNIGSIYHFTDRANLDSIKQYGFLYSWDYCKRNNINIPKPGGNLTSWQLDERKGLQNYVRLSFVKDHPMMFVALNDGRISNAVVLEIDPKVIFFSSTMFTVQNAARNGVFADNTFEKFNQIKFGILRSRYRDLCDEDKHNYQAEVLFLEKLPIRFIRNL